MMHDFELHEFFHSPKNVLLKALLYFQIRTTKQSVTIKHTKQSQNQDSNILFTMSGLKFQWILLE